jgi:hypothetical protein
VLEPLVDLASEGYHAANNEEGAVMEFHSRTHEPPKALDPAVDPAYHDGIPPRPRQANHAGEIAVEWPGTSIPSNFQRLQTISIEELEAELEREAAREEIV